MNMDPNAFNDPSLYDAYGTSMAGGGHNRVVSLDGLNDGTEMNSGQLIRRNPNQQLAAAPRRNQWEGFPNEAQPWETVDDDEELEQKAAVAKKDAQAKRKQIPPFVQKLSRYVSITHPTNCGIQSTCLSFVLTHSSFLDNNKNENLIRWSDDGNSFIVLDEDEFARTLIPELFKHNNYASFVRQLNMYGFHKKVGLSDNSMKASETKAKAPSEYFNKYFKRGRQELLWLIQKPKNPPTGPKRKRDEDSKGDSDDERKYVQDTGGGGFVEDLTVRNTEQMAMIPRSEYNSLRVEVRELQQQQKLISNVLTQIKRQNEELYSRATSFQALHDRHENSINAILTFLATFYNRSLEGNASGLNLADMFPAARQQPHGNVVDVDDFPPQELHKSPQLQRTKRPLAILPAPPTTQQDLLSPMTTGRATTMSPTTRPMPSPLTRSGSRQSVFKSSATPTRQQSSMPASQGRDSHSAAPIKMESPSNMTPLPETDEIMSAIQNANANAGQATNQAAPFDYAAALSGYQTQDGNVPLTTQQRNDVLSQIANSTSAQGTNNALTNPTPPEMHNLLNDLAQYQATQQQLEMLQKLSDQQNSRIQHIQERVLPLSPSGQIAGLTDDSYFGNTTLGEPGQYDLDFDNLVQDQDFYPNGNSNNIPNTTGNGNSGLPDFTFDTSTPFEGSSADAFNFGDGTGGVGMGDSDGHLHVTEDGPSEGRIESVGSSNATSPTATVEEVEDETRRRSPKRRKK